MPKTYLPILCLDFDGVIHSYTSGWLGPRNIPDLPVPGSLQFICEAMVYFDVHIYSTRSHAWFGRMAMRRWLYEHLVAEAPTFEQTPEWLLQYIKPFADPWPDQVGRDITTLVSKIFFPLHKPPALVTLDDRAITFTGKFPSIFDLRQFKPWNKKP